MEFTDKSNKKQATAAHTLIDGFLTRCNNGGFKPDDDLYDKMQSDRDLTAPKTDTTYNLLRRQLLQESSNRCCYCMRRIEEQHTTLEHIIPNKIATQKEYDWYKPYYSNTAWSTIVFAKAFLLNPRWPYRAYPHTVAYENLIPSCNGKFARLTKTDDIHAGDDRDSKCCNNKRGNAQVIPFVLDKKMVEEFKYNHDGYVVWLVDASIKGEKRKELVLEHKKTIDALGLNCPELVAIRRIWFFLSALGYDCTKEVRERALLFLSMEPNLTDEEMAMLSNFCEDNYWCLLEDYRYFNDRSRFK